MGCLSEDEVLGFVRGEMSAEDIASLDAHVDGCAACRELVAQIAQTSLAAARSSLPSEPPPDPRREAPTAAPGASAARDVAGALLPRGATVDRYVVIGPVGAGAMGVVYAAYDPELDRKVALKLLRLGALGPHQLEDARQRLVREAQAMARVSDDNVIQVHDVGTYAGQVFVAMEFVEGSTLGKILRDGADGLPLRDVLDLFLAAGRGLAAAHRAGLVHRDFKPENVLVGRDGSVRVSDFGLARPQDIEPPVEPTPSVRPLRREVALSASLTQSGAAVGTPVYMSPEQHAGKPPDPRSDQWSFCVALHEGLYGVRPFAGPRLDVLALAIASGVLPEPPPRTTVPSWARRVIARGLRVDPEERYADMDALLADLAPERRNARRRLWALGAVAAVSIAALATTRLGQAARSPEQPCRGTEDRVASVWSPERKAAGRSAFVAAGGPGAGEAWRRVEAALDAWAGRWAAMRTDACEATKVRGEQSETMLDLRMACLDRRLAEAAALVDVLARADPTVVATGAQSVLALGSLDACADAAALRQLGPPPSSEEERSRVAAVETRVARAAALLAAGRVAEGLTEAEAAALEARMASHEPLEAEALLLLADAEDRSGEPARAEQSAEAAVRAAIAGRHDLAAAEGWVALVHLTGYERARHERAHEHARFAEAALARLEHKEGLAEALDVHLGLVLVQQGRYDEAEERFRRAIDRTRRERPDDPRLSLMLDALAMSRFDRGDLSEALRLHDEGRALLERVLGPEHPDVSESLVHVAGVLWAEGRYDEALAHFRRVLAAREAAVGSDPGAHADVILNIGVVLCDMDRAAEALPHFQRALPLLEQRLGAEHPDVARALYNEGVALRRLGRHDDAERALVRAQVVWEQSVGGDHVDVAMATYELAELRRDQKRHGDAKRLYERALGIVERSVGLEHRGAAYVLEGMGRLALAQKRPDEATERLERALLLQQGDRLDAVRLAGTRFALARALWESGKDKGRARALAAETRSALGAAGDRGRGPLAEVEAWLAERR